MAEPIIFPMRLYRRDPPDPQSGTAPAGTEPIILQMRLYDHRSPPDEDPEPGVSGMQKETRSEEFWAGRNHAMRRSARVAA
jgi:hypothetical protein